MLISMKEILLKLKSGEDLSSQDVMLAFNAILGAGAPPEVTGAFLMGLSAKGESATEIAAAASYLRAHAHTLHAGPRAVDCCGTGGDVRGTYNISTAVALVCAACGVQMAKHGNRAASSKSGAADVLEALGVHLDVDIPQLEDALQKFNFAFLMAPRHHHILKPMASIRKELGFPTIFNLLGPLANPASAKIQLLGVYDKKWLWPMAEALKLVGARRAWVVHGRDGLDEITLTAETDVVALEPDGTLIGFTVSPETVGLKRCLLKELQGGDAGENATALAALLQGAEGAYRQVVLLNAAAVLVLAGVSDTLKDGVGVAAQAVDSGRAWQNFEAYRDFTAEAGAHE
ncbi:MAG: anthranilate phosphoribosyltransferase [Rhodospirillales bacterium]|nr:anthranilate phosphoribosyltransferase [Rhodospirillales bacterium]MCB9965920.1 anthranilate phosphoribosyltransferase [Rhodospirillales bacterium]